MNSYYFSISLLAYSNKSNSFNKNLSEVDNIIDKIFPNKKN